LPPNGAVQLGHARSEHLEEIREAVCLVVVLQAGVFGRPGSVRSH
jgi:hypothetical protein